MSLEELLALTPEQEKAWRQMKAGFKAFTKAGGKFYTILESVHAYNGEYVNDITGDENESAYPTPDAKMDFIFNSGLAGFADDAHFIHLTTKGEKLLEEDA
ncbi:hypothetical protein [Serratia fonticola]|uniref:hypothetical protein n=1 Tax=Serratia fonticola TaxID=47917 RepID=UPI0021795503|nr:hypothetical protein [Serratia fonticola]CAI1036884.1 Uncharacterised protein [Serratia fonticola]